MRVQNKSSQQTTSADRHLRGDRHWQDRALDRAGAEFDGEVINADSRYFYRDMDIGVAKPTRAERKGVPHHLIDILELDDPDGMSLAVFQRLAFATIDEVLARDRFHF